MRSSRWWLVALAIVGWGVASPVQAQGRLFGITGAGSTGGATEELGGGGGGPLSILYELNPATGAVIDSIGATGFHHVTSMSFDPISRRLFGLSSADSNSMSHLIEIDTQTGVGRELVPEFPAPSGLPDMSFSGSGNLFAWSESGDNLVSVDLTTGALTDIGPGVGSSQTGLAFNSADSLFVKPGTSFYSLDPITGVGTLITTFVDSTSRGGGGLKNALEFAPDGRLFSIDAFRQLAIIDRATSSFRSLNQSGPPLAAIAFLPDPPLPITQGVVNVDGQIAADLRGNPTNVRLFYRAGGEESFATVPMTQSTFRAGRFLGPVPGQDITFRGVQYFVEADYGALGGVITIPEAAPGVLASFAGAGSTPAFSTGSKSFVLIGSPITPNDTNPEAVFDELGAYDTKKWRYGVFDAPSGSYVEPPGANARTASGQGFWLITKDPSTIVVDGKSADLSQNFSITLREGFNQIANPFAFSVDVADLVIPAGVEANFISWNGSGYVAGNATLSPGVGYFVRNNGPGFRTLEIPPIGSGVARSIPQIPGVLADHDLGWTVEVRAAAGTFSDAENRFGQRDGATNERDALDWSDPPAPPAGFATVSLVAEDGRALFADYRTLSAEGASWTVRFESDQAGEPYRVTFSPDRELPADWSLVAFESKGARETDLLATGMLTGVVGSESYAREWTVVAGNVDYLDEVRGDLRASVTTFALSAPFPNPIGRRDITSLDLEIPARTHARVQVFDVQGRLVRTLVDGVLDRGAHRVEWDGSDRSSRTAAAGVYFVKVEAGDFATSRKVVRLQ